jgi:hypothetical protein
MRVGQFAYILQRKKKSKVHRIAGGREDSIRYIALGVLRTQAFVMVYTEGDGHSWKFG